MCGNCGRPSFAPTHFILGQSIAPVQVASGAIVATMAIRPRLGWALPRNGRARTPATVSLKPTRPAQRADGNQNRLVRLGAILELLRFLPSITCLVKRSIAVRTSNVARLSQCCIWFVVARLSDHIDQQVSRCVFGKQRLSPA